MSNNQKIRILDVLLIESDWETAHIIEKFCEIKGYSIEIATTGQRGLDVLKKSIPKLILLSIMLPDIAGYEVCKQIKSNNNLKNILVFYFTTMPEKLVKYKVEETGADGYILKPFSLSELSELLESIV
ncbi:MAG: PleD family two-component system response regulator [Candidatus Hodarchaeota archaeon]